MIIYRQNRGYYTYQMTDAWGKTHDMYATQLLEWAVIEPEVGNFSTYDNGYTKDKVQMYVERKNGVAVRRFRVEPPTDFCGSSRWRESCGFDPINVKFNWSHDSWIVPSKWSRFVDGLGNPLVFT